MLLKATCRKCGKSGYFDIGDMKKEEVLEKLSNQKTFQCIFGNHVEVMSPVQFMDFDWDNLIEGELPKEEEFLNELRSRYGEVYTKEELQEKYVVDSFMYGQCLCHSKNNEDDLKVFNFVTSPNGKRYYVLIQ
ncbi:MAG: hypothetical protein N2749_00975 [Clostridia bacterium]|nr:hypothetical protein [Clostridia bacterium]